MAEFKLIHRTLRESALLIDEEAGRALGGGGRGERRDPGG